MSSSPSADGTGPRRVAVLGSTGSIGRQAVEVLARHPDAFRVVALAAGRNRALLEEQARLLRPAAVALTDPSSGAVLDLPSGTAVAGGAAALDELATRDDVDIVVVGTSGIVSLRPVLAALAAGKIVATANKETLVAGGHLVMPLARQRAGAAGADPRNPMASPLAWLRPIDSEHSAIWQCLVGEGSEALAGIVLTASGGPFLDGPADLSAVTPDMALRHPTWRMGSKITIDSATLANKGLEVIEAHWLYDVDYDAIEVVIHPQSVVHSAVRFVDGSLKAQLGTPDMRLPIQYAADLSRSPSVPGGRRPISWRPAGWTSARRTRAASRRSGSPARPAGPAPGPVPPSSPPTRSPSRGSWPAVSISRASRGCSRPPSSRFGGGGGAAPGLDELIALDGEVRAAFAAPVGSGS